MFTKADIMARLADGASAEDIAKEMADTLNEAEAEYEAETKRKEEEKSRKVLLHEAKVRAAEDMLDAMCDFATAAEETELLEALREANIDDVVDMMDSIVETTKMFKRIKDLHFEAPVDKDDTVEKMFKNLFS